MIMEGMRMTKIKCVHCGEIITGRHVIDGAAHYCNDECADADWRERGADLYAREASGGLIMNFEDYMRDRGATICGDYDMPQREY